MRSMRPKTLSLKTSTANRTTPPTSASPIHDCISPGWMVRRTASTSTRKTSGAITVSHFSWRRLTP